MGREGPADPVQPPGYGSSGGNGGLVDQTSTTGSEAHRRRLPLATAPVLELRGFGTIADISGPDREGVTRYRIRHDADPLSVPGIESLRAKEALADASFLKAGPSGTVFPLEPA